MSGQTPLLAAFDVKSQVHLIIGANPLAAARCSKSLDAGAVPILIAPPDGNLHASLAQKVEDGKIRWIQRAFGSNDLKTLGREEVDYVVETVFVTSGGNNEPSKYKVDIIFG